MHDVAELVDLAKNHFNVLLIGSHGIGKTQVCLEVAKTLGLKISYFSASVMDPYIDFVGVPIPKTYFDVETNQERTVLHFAQKPDLDDVEFIFIDELNRAQPAVLNGVFELIQFKSLNGKKLPKLKMVWAAVNPPGSNYAVEELDPALEDRFHAFVKLEADPDLEVLSEKISVETAEALITWWTVDLTVEQRKAISPRRLEYIGTLHDRGLDFRLCFRSSELPTSFSLSKRLTSLDSDYKNYRFTNPDGSVFCVEVKPDLIRKSPEFYQNAISRFRELEEPVADCLRAINFKSDSLFQMRDVIEVLSPDLVFKVLQNRSEVIKSSLKSKFRLRIGTDWDVAYPKIARIIQ